MPELKSFFVLMSSLRMRTMLTQSKGFDFCKVISPGIVSHMALCGLRMRTMLTKSKGFDFCKLISPPGIVSRMASVRFLSALELVRRQMECLLVQFSNSDGILANRVPKVPPAHVDGHE